MHKKVLHILLIAIFLFNNCTFAKDNSYQRIISLGPSITEQLYLLGAQDQLVAVTNYCTKPASAKEKEKVGTVIDADLEKIISLKPDLVLTTSLTNPKAKEKLKNLGIKIVDFPYAGSFYQLCEQFLKLAKLVNKKNKAQEIIQKVNVKIESIKKSVKNRPKPKVFIQIGTKPLHTANQDSFINDFMEFAGGINIAKNSSSSLYSKELVLKNNPDIIIISTMGLVGEMEKKAWQKYKTLNAVKFNRIYVFDSDKLCSPTPVTFLETLEELVKILHESQPSYRVGFR